MWYITIIYEMLFYVLRHKIINQLHQHIMESCNLYLFPALPGKNSGYEWAVKSDISQLNIKENDIVVFFALKSSIGRYNPIDIPTKNIYYVHRNNSLFRLLFCLVTLQHPSFFLKIDWTKLPENVRERKYNKVFFGDTIFYSVYHLIKHNITHFRFHNLWSRIFNESKFSLLDLKNSINMKYFTYIESKILKLNASFLFITEKDKEFAFIDDSKSSFFPINIDIFKEKEIEPNSLFDRKAIIWFGSISTHKHGSVKSFIRLFQELRKEYSDLVFLLYGSGSDQFDDRENNIWGLGFYEVDSSFPITSKCIYINPDDTGGGIKIKNFDIIKTKNINYLSTPEGFEGCEIYLRDGIKVLPITKWYEYLNNYFK